jgi:hypothetical protein
VDERAGSEIFTRSGAEKNGEFPEVLRPSSSRRPAAAPPWHNTPISKKKRKERHKKEIFRPLIILPTAKTKPKTPKEKYKLTKTRIQKHQITVG